MKTPSILTVVFLFVSACYIHAATGGPDAYGYRYTDSAETDSPGFEWVEISTTGAEVISSGSNASSNNAAPVGIGAPVQLAHPFTFYGNTITELVPTVNGYLSTDTRETGSDATRDCPLPATPSSGGGARIYAYHLNWEIIPGGGVYYQYFKESPHSHSNCGVSVFTWKDVRRAGTTAAANNFQVLLFDSGDILVQIFNNGSTHFGDTETIGIQSADVSSGIAYGCPDVIPNTSLNDAILFTLPGVLSSSAQASINNSQAGSTLNYGNASSTNPISFGWDGQSITINKPLTIAGRDVDNLVFDARYGLQAKDCIITIDGALVNIFDARFFASSGNTFRVINGGHLHLCDSSILGAGTNAIFVDSGSSLTMRRSVITDPAPRSGSHIVANGAEKISLFKSIVSESWGTGLSISNKTKDPRAEPQKTNFDIELSSIVRNRQMGLSLSETLARITQSTITDNLGSGISGEECELSISNSNITSNKSIGLILTESNELLIDHSIIAGNVSAETGEVQNVDFSAGTTAVSTGSNLSDSAPAFLSTASDQTLTDPLLTPLAGYGELVGAASPSSVSPLLCQLPLHNSPVIDASQSFIQIETSGTDLSGSARLANGDNSGAALLDTGAVEATSFITVTTAADQNNSPPGANVSLREALATAQGERIVFASGLNGQVINLSSTVGGQGTSLGSNDTRNFVDASSLPAGLTVSGNSDMVTPLIGGAKRFHGITFTQGRNSVSRNYSGVLILTNCILSNTDQDAATNAQLYAQMGGAIFNAEVAYLVDCTFLANQCHIEKNSSAGGGAYASFPTSATNTRKPILSNHLIRCKFIGNFADGQAGAVFITGGRRTVIDGCTISENVASISGGAVLQASQLDFTYLDITRTSVVRNRATSNRSALTIFGATSNGILPEEAERITMSYCTLSGNNGVSSTEGALFLQGADLFMEHCTIVENLGELAGGITSGLNGTIYLRNSILSNNLSVFNTQFSPSNLSFQDNGSFVSEGNNLSGDSVAQLNQMSDITNTPPRLAPLTNNLITVPTHNPLHDSPALDGATASAFAVDARGYPGRQGARPDIGAVESAVTIVVTTSDDELNTPTGAAVSLREALRDARDGSRITFSSTLSGELIDLRTSASGQGEALESDKNVIVDATMLPSGITVHGAGSGLRCLTLPDGEQSFSLHGVSFRNGEGSTNGSAIYKGLQTDLTITNAAIYNCISPNAAGAVHANGSLLTLENVTLYNNGSVRGGSALSGRNAATISLRHCTVFNNPISTTNFPGGAAVFLETNAHLDCNHTAFGDNLNSVTSTVRNLLRFGPATVGNAIFSIADDNRIPSALEVSSLDLKPLQDAGGLAFTCPPEQGSPVVDDGYSLFVGSPASDARGFARRYGPRVDVGAYELGSFLPETMDPPVDVDGDGMDDNWEEYYGLLFEGPDDDGDLDDLSNLGEYLSQTDPGEFDSIPETVIMNFQPGPIEDTYLLTFASSPSIAYELWYSSDLDPMSFSYLLTVNGAHQGSETQILIENSSFGGGEKVFFRVQRP